MKKIYIAILALVVLTTAGCSTKPKETENTPIPTPVTTPGEATSTPMEGNQATEKPMQEETVGFSVTETTISGTFVEDTENSPTTITFNEDGTFKSNVNICSGYLDVTGSYKKDGNSVSISIPKETGVVYIDNDQPFTFDITDTVLEGQAEGGFSCADVGKYTAK